MKRAVLTVAFMLMASVAALAQNTFYFPQIADGVASGSFWKTTIYLTNPAATGTSLASGSVTFMNSAGQPFNVQFLDSVGAPVGSGNVISFQIAGGQTRKYVSSGTAPLATGFATVTSTTPVTGTAIFSLFAANGSLVSEAGVPAASALVRQAIVVDTLGGFNTGVAYANPGSIPSTVSLQLLNSEGVSVLPSTFDTLPASGHKARFVTEFFTTPLVGTLRITGDYPIAAVALRFDPTATLFTTLPSISLATLLPSSLEWLEQRPWLRPLASLAHLLGSLRFRLG